MKVTIELSNPQIDCSYYYEGGLRQNRYVRLEMHEQGDYKNVVVVDILIPEAEALRDKINNIIVRTMGKKGLVDFL